MNILMNLIFVLCLLIIAYKDMNTKTIPNSYLIPIILLTVLKYFMYESTELMSGILGSVVVSVPMLILTMIKTGSFGGGDIKLSIVCGGYLGTVAIIKATVVAIFLAGLCIVLFYKKHNLNRKSQIAFGPYLAMGCIWVTYIGR